MAQGIVVFGMHRSGTSLITSMIAEMGANAGDRFIVPGEDNPEGFFEDAELNQINERILHRQHRRWFSVKVDAPDIAGYPDPDLRTEMESVLGRLRGDERLPYVIKDPRLCLLFPYWQEALAGDQVMGVWVYRSPWAVARSLMRRDDMDPSYAVMFWWAYNAAVARLLTDGLVGKMILLDYDSVLRERQLPNGLHDYLQRPVRASERIQDTLRHWEPEPMAEVPRYLAERVNMAYAQLLGRHGTALTPSAVSELPFAGQGTELWPLLHLLDAWQHRFFTMDARWADLERGYLSLLGQKDDAFRHLQRHAEEKEDAFRHLQRHAEEKEEALAALQVRVADKDREAAKLRARIAAMEYAQNLAHLQTGAVAGGYSPARRKVSKR